MYRKGSKERLFEMFERVNKIKLNETFDVPKDNDEKYLDKSVDQEKSQVSKYDGGVDYPANNKLKVDDESLEKVVEDNEATIMKPADALEGGLGDESEVSDFDSDQVSKGIKIEMEHTNNPQIALEIALDHLKENPNYYTYLEKMEDNMNDDITEVDNLTPGTDPESRENEYSEMERLKSGELELENASKKMASLRDSGNDQELKK